MLDLIHVIMISPAGSSKITSTWGLEDTEAGKSVVKCKRTITSDLDSGKK